VPVLADIALDQLVVIRAIAERPVEGKPSDPAAHDQCPFRHPALRRIWSRQALTLGGLRPAGHGP
jgi:hypothetical protein